MKNILVTGATGNVGREVISSLLELNTDYKIAAGTRHPEKEANKLASSKVSFIYFDFEDTESMSQALQSVDMLFILRPPELTNIKQYFKPLIDLVADQSVSHIIFLSVQGAQKNAIIPHHKIEKLIVRSGIPYTFLRPAYFMQNFTTTLHDTLVERNLIYLPAGDAEFSLVDTRDVGRVAAQIFANPVSHRNIAYDLTSENLLTFGQMASILSKVLNKKITYESPNPLSFFMSKKKEGMSSTFIMVMIMLHYLPRFQSKPSLSSSIENITGSKPISFTEFVIDNKELLS